MHSPRERMFVINCKNYEEVTGDKIVKFVKTAERVAKRYGVKVAVAPPQHLAGMVAGSKVAILAQHVDDSEVGSTTGFVVPELLKRSKIAGSLVNHSEHRIPSIEIKRLVSRLARLNMISIVCVKNVIEARRYARFNPDYIAIEPPELIGSGKAVSKERPDLIVKAASAVGEAKNSTRLLCGAGIVSGEDVTRAIELGSSGILVASGIIKAKDWGKVMTEFASAMSLA